MTDLDLIIDLHRHTERQGPGSDSATLRALGFTNLPGAKNLKMADLGCGTGGPTLTLARNLEGTLTAVDLFPEFLQELREKSEKAGLKGKVNPLQASMDTLPFQNGELDLIWSEGAIYNIGFENGVKLWGNFLKPGGYLAVSEITWTTHSRPSALEDFWTREYPEIDTASNKIGVLEANGLMLTGYFCLDEACWMDNYYAPLEAGFEGFLKRHGNSVQARNLVAEYKTEIELYKTYKAHYSYGFYVGRKV
jgi:SAM-dependent methyltransferase